MSTVDAERTASLADLAARLVKDDSFQRLTKALRAGSSGTIDGAWGSSRFMAVAALAKVAPATTVLILPRANEIEPAVDDLRSFGVPAPCVFPSLEEPGQQDRAKRLRDEAFGRRLAVTKAVAGADPPRVVVTTIHALLQPIPTLDHVRRHSRVLAKGETVDLEELSQWLLDHGWQRRDAVELPGEFSRRGGILDLYSIDAEDPLRIEFFGDEIDSLREFSVESQRSLGERDRAELTALTGFDSVEAKQQPSGSCFSEICPAGSWFALAEPTDMKAEGNQYLNRLETPKELFTVEQVWGNVLHHPTITLSSLPHATVEETCTLDVETVERFSGDVRRLGEEFDKSINDGRVLLVCHNEAESTRLAEILAECRLLREGRIAFTTGRLAEGFRWISAGVVTISDHELFHRREARRVTPRRRHQSKAIDSFLDLREGDVVVHLGHGLSIYRGMKMLEKNGQLEEHLQLEFADQVMVYVPASKIGLVQKYVGGSKTAPRLSKIGGVSWERRKKAVERAVRDLAGDLLEVQAARAARAGIAFPPDSVWQREFEDAFEFTETQDQLVAIEEIRGDMERARPMDRLLCGDVGFGKTELAMRAAFKAVEFGKQVAVLVPTTVLAEQHHRTFQERMAEFPFVIKVLSRFQTKGQQRKVVADAAEGKVDILIGTHRLLSRDVAFQDLGLVIVDEEQRFGVEHKERLKQLRQQVDLLTMSATPIPRTLHSALLGIRDISNLETPPRDRLAIETRICRFEASIVRHAVLRELNRNGQLYFVHNRVHDMKRVADRILEIVPEARITMCHGQMHEDDIEKAMVAFISGQADILLATTIIESGLDIPNANTIFINEGDRYGLAELHQLRGRVGRSDKHAYCYVMLDDRPINPDALRRLKAIEEYSSLGSGFQIALRDLEIRGAGNILGPEQSGHIAAVGYELYCQLLENAVRAEQRLPLNTYLDVTIELEWKAYLPHEYLPGERTRIDTYRRLARLESPDEIDEFRRELEDRFGPVPETVEHLLQLAEMRLLAKIWQIESVRPDDAGSLLVQFRDERRIRTLAGLRGDELKVVDRKTAYARVPHAERNAAGHAQRLKRLLQPN
ncbi:Transcription-repair-coupling factor [Planctomycetes bacterium Pan216]|uniref:Transcription-repair-coupling factor n=1 Tax=Kolteria novifilia TaxID=2527975 RepID=A0A518B9S3_9BACT|nr:Transcription-repair-coupling factor [Planctomycetes bacterium Pan216]